MARLHTCARNGDLEGAIAGISAGADVDAFSIRSFTPLMIAAQVNHLSMVSLLLESGAQINLAHPNGRTALHFAASEGNLNIVQLLYRQGADLNAVGKGGYTPIIEAAMFNHHEVVSFLKECGANVSHRSREGLTVDEWLDQGGLPGYFQKRFPDEFAAQNKQNGRPLATECGEQHMRDIMADGDTPEEYVAKQGRRIYVFGYGRYSFRDPEVEKWTHRLAELLFTPGLLEQCEERYLTGKELEDARACRERLARRIAREAKKQMKQAEDQAQRLVAYLSELSIAEE